MTRKPSFAGAARPGRVLVVSALVGGLLAGAYALVTPRTWEAQQTFVVRIENEPHVRGLGEPSALDRMELAAETIQEVALSQNVLAATLRQVRAAAGQAGEPTEEQITQLRQAIRLGAPKETEAGQAELVAVRVRSPRKNQALVLASFLAQEIERRADAALGDRSQGKIDRLERDAADAAEQLRTASQKLADFERNSGIDAEGLRTLEQHAAGESAPPTDVAELETRLQTLAQAGRDHRDRLQALQAAMQNPADPATAGTEAFAAQPELRSLQHDLSEAQLRVALLRGTMSDKHPQVEAALANEQAIRTRFDEALAAASKGVEDDLARNTEQLDSLQTQLQEARSQSGRVTSSQSEYTNLTLQVQVCQEALQAAQSRLADARRTVANTAPTCSIKIDQSETAPVRQVGRTRVGITLNGALAGALVGLGWWWVKRPRQVQPAATDGKVETPARRTLPPSASSQGTAAVATTLADDQDLRQSLRKALASRF
ncbi:MAG: hypothetical protein JNG90_19130 [Planctomycetaceae bacterium]|nr:hypothetical protein [Planctomycetaceae bacterium]